jgi:hypothetical protein
MGDIALCRFTRAGNLDPEVVVLVPAGRETEDAFRKANREKVYNVKYSRSRSPQFHKFVMAIIGDLFDNQETYTEKEVFRTIIKLQCGWVYDDPIVRADGTLQWVVKPTNWTNCGEDEFREFFDKLKPIIIAKLGEQAVDEYRL